MTFLALLGFHGHSMAKTDSIVKKFFENLPEKSLTLPLVIQAAIKSSESFKTLYAQVPAITIPEIKARIPLDPQVYLKVFGQWDHREAQGPLTPIEQDGYKIIAGLSRYTLTGTSISLEGSYGHNDLKFNRPTPSQNNYETSGSIQVAQNFWRDAFGKETQKGLEIGHLERQAKELVFEESFEEWLLGIVGIYYKTWLWQSQAKAAIKNIERRQRLLNISQIKSHRGTAESQDLLQVESSLINAEIQETSNYNTLSEAWRELVILLKLPEYLLDYDAKSIPMKLDQSPSDAFNLCHDKTLQRDETHYIPLQKLSKQSRVAQLAEQQARALIAPKLQGVMGLSVNGVDRHTWPTVKESFLLDHTAWSIGVNFNLPLEMYADKAAAQGAAAERMRAEATYQSAKDLYKVNWLNACKDLYRLKETRDHLQSIVKKQSRREVLEEELFKIGRSSTLQIIQAGDDASASQLSLNQIETEMRMAAWKVRRLGGKLLSWPEQLGLPSLRDQFGAHQ